MMRRNAVFALSFAFAACFISNVQACDRKGTDRKSYSYPLQWLWQNNTVTNIYNGNWGFAQSAEVCSYDAECFPWRSGNGQYLLFASINLNGPPRSGHQGTENWDIYISEWNPTGQCWGTEVNIGTSINSLAHERRPSCNFSCDTLYFDRSDDIYMSVRDSTGWSTAVVLPFPVNTISLERHPAISADGQRLYFTSDRPGSLGGMDIWVALWNGASWDSVYNLGPPINTLNEETRPFESYDEQRLYFSNNHGQPRPGISYGGASDIYVSTWADTCWGPVYLVVAPINSDLTACSPYEFVDGNEIWFGSEAWEGGRGDEDIWVAAKGESPPPAIFSGYGHWTNTGELQDAIYIYDLKESADGTIYAAAACSGIDPTGSVFMTEDFGDTWSLCAYLPAAMVVYSLLVDGDTIYAGTYPNGDVFKSINRGSSWVNTADLPGVTSARSLVRLNNGDILVGTSPYDVTMRNRIFRSTDGGVSWVQTGLLPHINPCKFLYQTSSGSIFAGGWGIDSKVIIHQSVDNGVTWDSVTVISQDEAEWTADRFIETENGDLYVTGWIPAHGPGSGGGYVCKSEDDGANWSMCPKIMRADGVHSGRVYSITEDAYGRLYVGMQPAPDSVVYASSDGGESWYSTGGLEGTFECLCLLYSSDGYIYAGTTPNGDVFKYRPQTTHVDDRPIPGPPQYILEQSYPNPFNATATIRFRVPEAAHVKINVYDVLGRFVTTLVDDDFPAGWHEALFNGIDCNRREISSGIYFYRMEAEQFTCVKKFLVLK
jgi:photosystem II stability/assembly factor-like uncharacterized protein